MGVEVLVHDPVADPADALREYGVSLVAFDDMKPVDAIIVAVAYNEYINLGASQLCSMVKKGGVFMDLKSLFERSEIK